MSKIQIDKLCMKNRKLVTLEKKLKNIKVIVKDAKYTYIVSDLKLIGVYKEKNYRAVR